jgi:hypothetical protein
MRAVPPLERTPLQRAWRLCALGLLLLVIAGFRHHLVWGERDVVGVPLRPLLDAGETCCLVGFAWFGARGWSAAVAAVREGTPGLRVLVRATLPLLVLGIAAPAFLSADVADYVMRGRVVAVHGANPYVHVAAEFSSDPFLAFGDGPWKRFPLPYGPLVADVQAAVAWLAQRAAFLPVRAQFVGAVVLFKTLFAGCLLASALLARRIAAVLRGGDGDAMFVALAWNPLLLNEGLASAHNESLVLLTILAAVHAAITARPARAAVAIGLGALTKIVPVLLVPLFLVHALRTRRLGRFAAGAAVALVLCACYWLRWFREPGALDFLQRQSALRGASPVQVAARLTGVEVGTALLGGRIVVLGVLANAMVWTWRRPDGDQLLRGSASVLLAMICCGLSLFGPWYHLWWVPLALLHGRGFLYRCAVAATWLAPLGYVLWTSLRTLDVRHEIAVITMGMVLPMLLACVRRAPLPPGQHRT